MWETLPIQRNVRGPDFTFINREKDYPLNSDVEWKRWKEVPDNVKKWCLSIWQDVFNIKRNPVEQNDLLFWIPQKGILVAKYGHFIGCSKSRRMIYVCYNFVCEHFRGEGLSKHLILTMANKCKEIYGPITFMFELRLTPHSLTDALPFMKFTYVWIPFLMVQVPPKWKSTTDYSFLKGYCGFHSIHWKGYKAFKYENEHILLDPANDIVYYDNYLSLYSFDGMKLPGAYCRVFSPFGDRRIFVQNLFFDDPDYFMHYLLV